MAEGLSGLKLSSDMTVAVVTGPSSASRPMMARRERHASDSSSKGSSSSRWR